MKYKTYNEPCSEVQRACIKALKQLGARIETQSTEYIKASTGLSLRSWGEIIEITIYKIDRDLCKVEIRSYPKAQLIDWGKSEENEMKVISLLDNLLGENR